MTGKEFHLISDDRVEEMQTRIAELEEALREGVEGFGRVLVQTSDQAGVNDWRRRARKVLDHEQR